MAAAEGDVTGEPPPPPSFAVDWRTQAVFVEAGCPGVDAAAVCTALVGLSQAQDTKPLVVDTQPLLFAQLSHDDLNKAASAAEEGSLLHEALVLITKAREDHVVSEDSDKAPEFFAPTTLIANLFNAFAETDKQSYVVDLTTKRTAAFDAATAAFEEASAHVDEAQASVTSAVETHELKLEEHRVLMEQWDEGDDTDDGPGPGPDYELVVTAIDALNSAKDGRTAARRAVATAQKQRAAPAECAKTYLLAEDFFTGCDGQEVTADNQVARLAALAFAGLPVRAVVNVARQRVVRVEDENSNDAGDETAQGEAPLTGLTQAVPEDDDEFPPITAALMVAHETCVTKFNDFDAPAFRLASAPLAFVRSESGVVPDAPFLAKLLAVKCGVLCLASAEYQNWSDTSDIVRVPDDFVKSVTAELRSDAKEDPTDEEAGEETTDSDVLNAAGKIITQTPKPKNQMDLVEHRVYDQALAGVPHTRVSVAVVLDAMLREVCASACDPEDVTAASDAAAAAAAALFVTAALAMTKQSQIPSHVTNAFATTTSRSQFGFGTSNLGDTVSSSVFGGYDTHPDPGGTFRELPSTFQSGTNVNGKSFKPGTSKGFDPLFPDEGNDGDGDDESYPMDNQSRGVTLVPHGDAANVLRSRYATGGVGVSSTGNCSGFVTRSDPDAVELRMSSLLFAPGIHRNGMPDEPTLDDDQRGARKTALASFLGKPGGDPEYGSFHGSSVQQKSVSFGSHNHVDLHLHDQKISLAHAERRELMQRVADETLPLGVFSDHGDEVRHRRLWEPLTRAAYANSINAALSSFGTQNVTSKYFAPEDALLVTCHAAPHFEQMCDYSVNPATPWSEFFGAWENGFETVLETRVARDLKLAKQQKQFQDEDERRLETEESELNALPDDLREAELLKMEADKKLAEEARRAAEDEEAADWVWDGDASDDDDATPDDTEIDDSKDTDLDGRKWVTDPSNKKTVRRVRTAVVRLPRVSYAVLKEVGTCRGETNRLFPALAESVVAVSPDGGIDVVVAGVRLGLRTVTTRPHLPAGSHPGHKEHRIVLSLVDRPGACVVVGLAPADSKPAPVEKEEGEEDEGTEKVAPEETTEGDAEKEEETPAEPPAPKKNPVFVQYTCESGLCVSVTSDRVVCQTRADANANANATGSGNVPSSLKKSLAAHETCRAILPNGTTVTHSAFGTTILGVDGNTSTRASDTYSWIGTNSRGIRWEQADSFVFQPPPAPEEGATETEPVEGDTHAEEVDPDQTPTPTRGDIITPYPTFVVPVEQATVIDPETRAVVTSRADLTLVVAHPEFEDNASHKGSKGDSKQDDSAPNRNTKTLVVHADGTRVCRDVRAGCDWRVEKDGFAPTQSSSDTNTIDVDLGDAVASVDYDGVCSLNLGAYGALCVDVSGLVVFVAGNGVGLDATSAARRALIAATTPEGELAQCASSTIDYGDPDMDNAFVFDLGRGAVRFVDHAARRAEIGIGDGPRGRKAVASEASAAVFELGPSISEARLGEDGVDGETTPHAAAAPAQFVVTAKGGFRGACAFHELDPRSPPTPTPEAGGGEGHREETDAVASEPPASEKPAAEVPPSPAKSQVAPEPSGTTSTTVVGEHSQLSIFTPMTPAAPIKASLVSPRVFVAYPDQDEYFEVLSFASFAKYRAERASDTECSVDTTPVVGVESGSGAVAHTFLTPLRVGYVPPAPVAVPVGEKKTSAPGLTGTVRAVPSLKVPSVPRFPEAPRTLIMPRIASVDQGRVGRGDVSGAGSNARITTATTGNSFASPAESAGLNFVFRQVIEYPALPSTTLAVLDKALRDQADSFEEDVRVKPESYLLRDLRSDAFLVAEQNLADRVIAARRSANAVYHEKRNAELELEADEHARLAEEALDLGVLTLANEPAVAPVGKAPHARQKPTFPPCSFFQVEEGREALRAIGTGKASSFGAGFGAYSATTDRAETRSPRAHTLPPPAQTRSSSRFVDPLPNEVKLAEAEPPPVATTHATHRDRWDDEAIDSRDYYDELRNTAELRNNRDAREHEYGTRDAARDGHDELPLDTRDARDREYHASFPTGAATLSPKTFRGGDFSGDRTFRTAHRVDFTGRARSTTLAPKQYYAEKAHFVRNVRHEETEGNARRRLRTSSVALSETRRLEKMRGQNGFDTNDPGPAAQFELSPAHVHFGRVLPNVAVKRRVLLTNVSSDLGRFTVRQPAASSPFTVEHAPGMVVPGLAASLRVVCHATRPGEYVGEAAILTEKQVFVLSLSAVVVGRGETENVPSS